MSSQKALALLYDQNDKMFFRNHPDRQVHIRNPYQDECKGEFWTLGEHDKKRRRILLCRNDHNGLPLPKGQIMKIPFLAFADETIEDTDEVLVPIVREIMQDALEHPR